MNSTFNEAGFLTDIINYMATSDVDILRNLSDKIMGSKKDPNTINIGSNIAKAAAGLTAVFPVIVTEAVPLDQAVMVSKAIERKCVAMLQMLFAANQITTATGAFEYMKRFHTNLSSDLDLSGMDVDDVIGYTNKIGTRLESVSKNRSLIELADMTVDDIVEMSEGIPLTETTIRREIDRIMYEATVDKTVLDVVNQCKDIMHEQFIDEGINEGSLNDFQFRTVMNEYSAFKSTNTKVTTTRTDDTGIETQTNTSDDSQTNDIKNTYEILNKNVLKTDIAKANEATPSLMIVHFTSTIDNGDSIVNTCVIGVKARIQYVPSSEMISRIILKNNDRKGLLNFIRATTGEIKFFKDFLFAVDRAKVDAVAKSGKGSSSKVWKLLELRANRAKLNKSTGRNNSDAAAITTIVVSRAEADIIKKQYRIDITKAGTLLSIMKGYNLMCAVLVDEVSERVDFMYDDGSSNFETLSFMSLEREDSGGSYKKVINLLAKGR